MVEIFNGRYTARSDKPLVLFLIGMRLNKLWAAHKWLPVFTAMPRMLAELDRMPETGLLSRRLYFSGRVILIKQYWKSFDKLIAYAHDPSGEHSTAPSARTARWAFGTRPISSSRANLKLFIAICRCMALPP